MTVLFAMTFLMAGGEKLLGAGVPSWFREQFSGTLIDVFSGSVTMAYFSIAIAEAAIGATLALSLVPRLESLREFGMHGALCIFIALAFGQRLTHKFEDAAMLSLLAVSTYLVCRARHATSRSA